MSTVLLGVLGGGIVAAIITAGFNVYWDKQKQKITENWERRRYDANLKRQLLFGITDVFYSTKSEIFFAELEIRSLQEGLQKIEQNVDANLRASNPGMAVQQLSALKAQVVSPIQFWIVQMQVNRTSQYNTSVKVLRSRAEAWLSVAQRCLKTPDLYAGMQTMFKQFSRDILDGVDDFKKRFQEMEASDEQFKDVQKRIEHEIDAALTSKVVK